MKKIGLIGGTGPESTMIYYRELTRLVNQKKEGLVFPEIAIESVNLDEVFRYLDSNDLQSLSEIIFSKIRNLVNGGAEVIALTANTMHILYDQLQKMMAEITDIPLVNINEAAANLCLEQGYKKLALLGTKFTMQNDFSKECYKKQGIEVFTPEGEDFDDVQRIIYTELEHGRVKSESTARLLQIIQKLADTKGCQAVILGCTELPLAINCCNSPIPRLDIMELHIQQLVNMIM